MSVKTSCFADPKKILNKKNFVFDDSGEFGKNPHSLCSGFTRTPFDLIMWKRVNKIVDKAVIWDTIKPTDV